MNKIRLLRSHLPDGSATFGKLIVPDGWYCYTLENPWLYNAPETSCIPPGVYKLHQRLSPIVERTTRGKFNVGWEVSGVPGRSYIMIHPGNYDKDTQGCILPGAGFGWASPHGPMVTRSQETFTQLMFKLAEREEWILEVG